MKKLALVLCAFALILGGCGRQHEGQRCDLNNFDRDCDQDQDLECVPLQGSEIRNAAVCCPRTARATAAACLGTDVSLVDDASTPPPPTPSDAGSN